MISKNVEDKKSSDVNLASMLNCCFHMYVFLGISYLGPTIILPTKICRMWIPPDGYFLPTFVGCKLPLKVIYILHFI